MNYRLKPGLNKNNLTLELLKTGIEKKYFEMALRFHHSGATGEPTMNPEFLQIQEFLTMANKTCEICVHTNGDTNDENFWYELGKIYAQRGNATVQFALDGLEDTHHLYRVGTTYEKVLKNARAFMAGGGTAVWQYIIFKHNQHQVHDAMNLAKKYGFAKFRPIRSTRFIFGDHNQPKNLPHKLEPSTRVGNIEVPEKMITGLNADVCIKCRSVWKGDVAIYPDGTVWPCTMLVGIHVWHVRDPHNTITWSMIKKHILEPYGGELPNINKKTLGEIFLSDQWNAWEFVLNQPTLTCIQQCNSNLESTEQETFGPEYGSAVIS